MTFNKLSRVFIISMFFSFNIESYGQNLKKSSFDKELSFSADNDLFAFAGTDRYYTAGLFFKYAKVANTSKPTIKKRIREWEIGQMIFTPYKREVLAVAEIDRPVAGYLYGKFSQSTFTNKNGLFTWGLSAGTTGKLSLARQLIDGYHPFVRVNSDWWGWIWDYQVKDEVGVNANGSYAFAVINKNEHSHFQITPVTNATLGTSFTNISQSILLQAGKFNKMYESSYWNSRIESKNNFSGTNKNELFFFYEPEMKYQGYDATIQGGMFRNDKGKIVWPVKPFVFTHHLGLFLSNKRYSLSFHEFLQTKQAKFQFDNHAYGKLQVGMRF